MKINNSLALLTVSFVATSHAVADEVRELDAHEHGVGELSIAIDGNTVAMEFHAPGADIVGFEYKAESDSDLAKIEAAKTTLGAPLDLFRLSPDAACTVTNAAVELETEDHGEHEHEDEHKHEEHAEHDEHEDEHAHEHEHDEHADKDGHTEFHAEYLLSCENPDALADIEFTYFDTFPNAREVEVQIVTSSGARAYEVERDTTTLDLGS